MIKNVEKKLKNCKIRKKFENFETPYKNLEKYGSFSEFCTSTEKSVMLATLCSESVIFEVCFLKEKQRIARPFLLSMFSNFLGNTNLIGGGGGRAALIVLYFVHALRPLLSYR